MKKEKIKNILEVISFDQQKILDNLSPDERSAVGSLEHWTFKDVIVHSTYWWEFFINRLQASADGKEVAPTPDDINPINDRVLQEHKHDSWETVLQKNKHVRESAFVWLDKLSEEDLNNANLYDWMRGRSLSFQFLGNCWHDEWHFACYLMENGKRQEGIAMQENFAAKLQEVQEWEATAIYNLACFYSVSGLKQKAITALKKALRMRPELKEWAKQDPDLENIRHETEYQKIYEE